MKTTAKSILEPRAPFRFEHSLRFLCGFSPMSGEQTIREDEQRITKAIRAQGRTVLFDVAPHGTERPTGDSRDSGNSGGALEVSLTADGPLNAKLAREVFDRVAFFLSLDDDLAPFYALAKKDDVFAPLVDRYYGFHQVKLATPFENACWAILGQRCPVPVARKMKDRLVERTGGKIEVRGEVFAAFPEAHELAKYGEEAIAETIGNKVKARRIHSAAIAFAGADEERLRTGDIEEVHAWLTSIEGIGAWSAAFVLLRGLGRTERLFGSEKQLLPAMQELYGESRMPDVETFRKIAARYGDTQGYWALYGRTAQSRNINRRPPVVEDRRELKDLGSIGPAMLKDFEMLGIKSVGQLAHQQPRELYDRLSALTGARQDPCVEDAFTCAIAQAKDPFLPEEQRKWWYWSRVRKGQREAARANS